MFCVEFAANKIVYLIIQPPNLEMWALFIL